VSTGLEFAVRCSAFGGQWDWIGSRSRVTGVARLGASEAFLSLIPAFCARVHVLLTCDAGRAGAHSYHATRVATSNSKPRTPKAELLTPDFFTCLTVSLW
jgi:hypothetical protein